MYLLSFRCQHPDCNMGLFLRGCVSGLFSRFAALCLDATAYQNLFFISGLCPGLPRSSGAWDCLSVWEKCWNSFSGQSACLWEWWRVGTASIALSVDLTAGRTMGVTHFFFHQLIDDVLDFTSCSLQMGKPTSADLKLGLATGPVLFACQQVGFIVFEILLRSSTFRHSW